MIKGLTHDVGTGVINRIVKFKGKINTGYGPKEAPNTKNNPVPCGFFRFMKQVIKKETVNGVPTQYQQWMLDPAMQKLLQEANKGATEPRRLEAICMNAVSPGDMWESFCGKFSASDGLICKSYGEGSKPMHVVYEGEKRVWKPRLFKGENICPYTECPDYKEGKCKETGILHVYPLLCDRMNPYQFSTKSKNTILAIESSLEIMYNTMASIYCLANNVRKLGPDFRGLEGITYSLVHKNITSGGKKVFVTQVEFSDEYSAFAMGMIRTHIQGRQKLMMAEAKAQIESGILTGPKEEEPALIEGNRNPMIESGVVDSEDEGDGTDVPMNGPAVEVEAETVADTDKASSGARLDSAAADLLTK